MLLLLKIAKGLIFGILLMAFSEFALANPSFQKIDKNQPYGILGQNNQYWFEHFGVSFSRSAMDKTTLHQHYKGTQPDLNSMKNIDALFLFQVPLNHEKNLALISGFGPNYEKAYQRNSLGGYDAEQSVGFSHMLGMQYSMDKHISFHAEYTRHEGQLDHEGIFLGLSSRF